MLRHKMWNHSICISNCMGVLPIKIRSNKHVTLYVGMRTITPLYQYQLDAQITICAQVNQTVNFSYMTDVEETSVLELKCFKCSNVMMLKIPQ